MRGTIVNRGTSWGYKIYITDPQSGAIKQKWFGAFRTRKEAEVQLAEMLAKIHGGGMVPTTKLTMAELLEDWLAKYAAGSVRETSLRSYRDIVRQHLIPALGRIPARKLSPLDVQGYYTAKLKPENSTSGSTPRPLSASTVRKHHAVLHAALQYAVQNGLLAANVCDRVRPPKRQRKEPRRWDGEQVKLALGEMKRSLPHRIYALFLTLRTTGIRPGEALGLRWSDVDLTLGTLTIRQKFYRLGGSKRDREPTVLLFGPPKSDRGRRTIEIPPELVEALRVLKAEQDRLRQEFGTQYHDLGEHGPLVFC